MTRPSTIILAMLVAATTAAAERKSALAAEKVAPKHARTTAVQVDRPTVIVFVPPQWALDAKSDAGAVESIAHVRFAVDDLKKCKGTADVDVRMVFADRLALSFEGKRTLIDLSRQFSDSAGAYLLRSGKKPRAIANSDDTAGLGDILSRAVGEFFDVPGCLHER
jgi:hypothetical protein